MDAETRAALEMAKGYMDRSRDKWTALRYDASARLQALLDGEKGGVAALSTGDSSEAAKRVTDLGPPPDILLESRDDWPTVPAPAPDSAAKIAADLRDRAEGCRPPREHPLPLPYEIDDWAARVEALGLEPSERVKVAAIKGNLETLLADISCSGHHKCNSCELSLKVAIAALAPIAERKRIAIRVKVREENGQRQVVVQGACPYCGQWADLDTDQLLGQVSIMCVSPKGCTFHETEKIVGVEYE